MRSIFTKVSALDIYIWTKKQYQEVDVDCIICIRSKHNRLQGPSVTF